MTLTYHVMHIESGKKTECAFNKHHDELFNSLYEVSRDRLRLIALELVNTWNRAQPGTWHYWL